jgi:hypothetical protein
MAVPALPLRRNDMAYRQLAVALGLLVAAPPASAGTQDTIPTSVAPAGTPDTKYCMRIEAVTGSRLEELKCWTRAEWAEQGVDVDRDWAKEGVRTIG